MKRNTITRSLLTAILALSAGALALSRCSHPTLGKDDPVDLRITLRAQTEKMREGKWTEAKLEAIRRVLEARTQAFSSSPSRVTTQPPDQVIIEFTGHPDEQETLLRLTSMADLEFYLLPQLGNEQTGRRGTWSIGIDQKTNEEYLVDQDGKKMTPEQLDAEIFKNPDFKPVVTGAQLMPNSRPQIQPNGGVVISFEFNPEGAAALEDVTRSQKGEHLAIFLNKKLLTAPVIHNVISGAGIIEGGGFTLESAKVLSDQLNAGALPVPLETVKVEHPAGKAR